MTMKRLLTALLMLVMVAFCGSAGLSAEETRTPTQWLEAAIAQDRAEWAAASDEWKRVLTGAALAIGPYTGREAAVKQLKGDRKAAHEAFQEWMATEGDALYAKWRAGEALSERDRPYRYILNGLAFARYHHESRKNLRARKPLTPEDEHAIRHWKAVTRAGQAVLKKGYLGAPLTEAEVEALRLYAMLVDCACTGGRVLPFHLGLTETVRLPNNRYGLRLGAMAPEFLLPKMVAFLDSPAYTDANPHILTHALRPLILREHLLNLQGYEPDPGSDGTRVRAKPVEMLAGKDKHYVRLSDFRGKKPVLLVLANPSDAWCWHWKIAPMFEPLWQAYQDKLALFVIHTTIHDTYMPMKDFLGPTPGRASAVHELSLEERARASKMFYMNWPHFTFEYLLDDMSQRTRNAYRDQGGGAYVVLVDLDGRIAYLDYHQDVPQGLSFYDEYVYVRMNHLESRLKAFFDGGGRYGPEILTPFPEWRRPPLLQDATLVSADPETGTLAVRTAKGEAGKLYRFLLMPETRVTANYEPATLGEMNPGDKVSVSYFAEDADAPVKRARYVQSDEDWARRVQTIWIPGRVKSVQAADGRLEVTPVCPPTEQMKGLGFWDAAGREVVPYDPRTAARLTVVRRRVATNEDRICRFKLDAATDIFLHGRAAALDALRPGDWVGVLYRAFHDEKPLIPADQIRATRRNDR
jgi:hypothetical protein